jgi:hypothetical protein
MRTLQPLPDGAAERLTALLPPAQNQAAHPRLPCVGRRAALGLGAAPLASALGWPADALRPGQADDLRPGEVALASKPPGGGHHQKLTREQEKEWRLPFLQQAAAGGVLVVAPVPAAYEQRPGRPVPQAVVYRALPRQGGRQGQPRPRPPKAAAAVQEEFKKSSRPWSRSR